MQIRHDRFVYDLRNIFHIIRLFSCERNISSEKKYSSHNKIPTRLIALFYFGHEPNISIKAIIISLYSKVYHTILRRKRRGRVLTSRVLILVFQLLLTDFHCTNSGSPNKFLLSLQLP